MRNIPHYVAIITVSATGCMQLLSTESANIKWTETIYIPLANATVPRL